MGFSRVHSAQVVGLSSHIIDVEVDTSKGTHKFSVVGLPDKAVEESRDRVGSALKNTGLSSPKHTNKKIVVSMAPADIKKEGPSFDLPISLGYLIAEKKIEFNAKDKIFIGELSLDGTMQPIKGALMLTLAAKKHGFKEVFLPKVNVVEAGLVTGIKVFGVNNLREVVDHLNNTNTNPNFDFLKESERTKIQKSNYYGNIDFSDIKGQGTAKRALTIAAAGGHNIGLYGPPGTGKTMMAKAFRSILPPLDYRSVLEVTGIHSVSDLNNNTSVITEPPFRSPHHTSSYVAIVGGGAFPKPGEVTLAHRGVLFLDEFPEFDRRVIEALRQPLEDKVISISRAKGTEIFPANFILVAAMNPCPCGFYGTEKQCTCSPGSLDRYRKKLSGPLVDRIDMWVSVNQIEHSELLKQRKDNTSSESAELQKKVLLARQMQIERFKNYSKNTRTNSDMDAKVLSKTVLLTDEVKTIIEIAAKRMNLSPRSFHRLIKVARTVADLEEVEDITEKHILEAVGFRRKD